MLLIDRTVTELWPHLLPVHVQAKRGNKRGNKNKHVKQVKDETVSELVKLGFGADQVNGGGRSGSMSTSRACPANALDG